MNKKRITNILILMLCAMSLCGCGKEKKPVPPVVTEKEDEKNPVYLEKEPSSESHQGKYCLMTDQSDEFRDCDFKLGEGIEPPNKVGYTFLGYKDKNGTRYIDETGKLVLEYNGVDEFVVLWPEFQANEYEVIICDGNQQTDLFNKIVCKYDVDIKKDLPIGRVIEPKDKYTQKKVVTGFLNQNGNPIDMNRSKITLKQIAAKEDCIDHKEQKFILNVKTSDVTYIEQQGSNRTIKKGGYLKQKVNEKNQPFEKFDLGKTIDIGALKKLGYKQATICVSAAVDKGKGKPCIQVMNHKVKNKKEFKKKLLGVEKIKEKDIKKNGVYILKKKVTINKMKDNLYVYYNSANGHEWNVSALTVEISFSK